jgi:hypothetical protein
LQLREYSVDDGKSIFWRHAGPTMSRVFLEYRFQLLPACRSVAFR